MTKILIFFCFFVTCIPYLHGQHIIRRVQNHVLIDINESAGVDTGDRMHVFRTDSAGTDIHIGTVEIARFQDGRCAARIVDEHAGWQIRESDSIKLYNPEAQAEKPAISPLLDDLFNAPAFYKILRIHNDYILIDAGPESKLVPGHIYPVRRKTDWGYRDLGEAEILQFQGGRCAGKLVSYLGEHRIAVNDFVFSEAIMDFYNDMAAVMPPQKKKINIIGYGSLYAGLVSAGLGSFFHSRALATYEHYGSAKYASDALLLYDKAMQQRNYARIAFGVGGGLAAFGIVHILLRGNAEAAQQSGYSIMPIHLPNGAGLRLQIVMH